MCAMNLIRAVLLDVQFAHTLSSLTGGDFFARQAWFSGDSSVSFSTSYPRT
jgi:hypothetical protein